MSKALRQEDSGSFRRLEGVGPGEKSPRWRAGWGSPERVVPCGFSLGQREADAEHAAQG